MSIGRPLALLLLAAGMCGCVGPSGPRPPPAASTQMWPIAHLPPADPAGAQPLWNVASDQQTRSGRWYLDLAGSPVTLTLTADAAGTRYDGLLVDGDGATDLIDSIAWDDATGVLEFRRVGNGFWQWVHARAIEGVLVGRASYSESTGDAPLGPSELTHHVTGWNEVYFGRDIVPRVFDLTVGDQHARLRLDRDGSGALIGRFKVFADDDIGNRAEEIEYDLDVQQWDGQLLRFACSRGSWTQTFTGTVDGRTLSGTMQQTDDPAAYSFSGTRAELLTFGFVPHDAAARADWQQRARRQLTHLMMADNPSPLSTAVQRTPIALDFGDDSVAPDRDDDAGSHPPSYRVDEVTMQLTLPNQYGSGSMSRTVHGYLTTPPTSAPPGGWPAVITLNGHQGSAAGTLDPYDPMYWYGDAWARRDVVVLTLDVGHRPLADRAGLYTDYTNGDDPDSGNATHPAIEALGFDSDWVEDGERVWDALRGIDYLGSLGTVDMSRVAMTGLSMGAEVTTLAAAIDRRVAVAIPAGDVPELEVMAWNGNHPCWQWAHGKPLDYFDVADLHGLIAPRPLVLEAGRDDNVFSRLQPYFIDAKEVTRRSRAAYADTPATLVVYLHPGGHDYRFGDVLVSSDGSALDIETPTVTGPRSPGDLDWAQDGSTTSLGVTLAEQLASFFRDAAN